VTQFTDRDRIWNNALKKEDVHPSHYLDVYGVSERTARDVLETMHEMGVLESDGGQGTRVTYSSRLDHPVP
jgi:DNA-binding FadR family transcriptional regulator